MIGDDFFDVSQQIAALEQVPRDGRQGRLLVPFTSLVFELFSGGKREMRECCNCCIFALVRGAGQLKIPAGFYLGRIPGDAMKRILLAGLGLFVLAATQSAVAADKPLPYKAPPLVDPIFNWTGFYIGLNAGYSWGTVDISASDAVALPPAPYTLPPLATTLHPASFIGGGQAGFNWQMGNVVWGLEADIAWRNGKDNFTFAFPNGLDFASFHVEQNWVGTVRPRLGIAANNWLFYVTGGLAYGALEHSYMETRPTVAGANRTASENVTRAGWTAGGGVQVAFNPQLSLAVEYLYMDFGSSTLSFPAQVLGGVTFAADTATFRDISHVVRAKLNWRM